MSTTYTWLPGQRKLWIRRFREQEEFVVPKEVEFVSVKCDGRFPEVILMTPPRNPLEAAAWRYGFYKGRRRPTLEAAQEAIWDERHRIEGEGYLFLYDEAIGDRGVPKSWWASPAADVSEIKKKFEECFGY